jgi:hypothetical protein
MPAGWCRSIPEDQDFSGTTLEEAPGTPVLSQRLRRHCRQVPSAVHVVPLGQQTRVGTVPRQALDVEVQGVESLGHAATAAQVAGSRNCPLPMQMQASLVGQQMAPGEQTLLPPDWWGQRHWPATQCSLTPQRLPQAPQLRGSPPVLTHDPLQSVVPLEQRQRPLWQIWPPGPHGVPLGRFFLHLPCLRFLHGGQALFFLASVVPHPSVASAPPRTTVRAARREPALVRERARASKRALSMPRSSRNA